jgi:hypothetical protein
MRFITLAAALLGLVLVAGCGSGHKQQAASQASATKAKPDDGLARMVTGVTSVKPGSSPLPLQLKFDLRARPEVGHPLDVDIAVIPMSAAIDRVFGKVVGEEGLDLVSGGELQEAGKPVEGTPIQYSLKVLPKQDGIYTLTATISVDSGGVISSQTYTMPVIAGQGIPDLPAPGPKRPATAAAASASH